MLFTVPALGPAPFLTLACVILLAAAMPMLLLRGKAATSVRGALVVAALLLPAMAVLASSISRNSLAVRDGQVVVHAGYFYEYARDIRDFDLGRARHGSQAAIAPQGLGTRANGIRLPGYAAGSFADAGRQPMFVTLTDRERVVYLPARRGESLLVSVEQGDALLQMLYDAVPATR